MLGWVAFNILGERERERGRKGKAKPREGNEGEGTGLRWIGFFKPHPPFSLSLPGPAINQLKAQADKNASAPKSAPKGGKRRGVAAGLGLGAASLLAASAADAATDVAAVAAGDGRAGAIALLLVPLVGVVALNIGQPALNQLAAMSEKGAAAGKPAKAGRR